MVPPPSDRIFYSLCEENNVLFFLKMKNPSPLSFGE